MSSGELVAIAIRDRSRAPMQLLDEATISVERGVEGDFRGKPGPRQVTVLGAEGWQSACDAVGEALPWTLRRANLLVRGVELAERVGDRLRIGDVLLEIMEEADPCMVMDGQHEGLRAALVPAWRGGVCCRVIRGAAVAMGAPVGLEPASDD